VSDVRLVASWTQSPQGKVSVYEEPLFAIPHYRGRAGEINLTS